MRRSGPVFILAGVIFAAAAACQAGEAVMTPSSEPMTVDAAAGLWRIDGGAGRCRLVLQKTTAGGDHVAATENCAGAPVAGAARWRIARQGIEIMDAAGRVLLILHRTGVDAFATSDGVTRISRAPEV